MDITNVAIDQAQSGEYALTGEVEGKRYVLGWLDVQSLPEARRCLDDPTYTDWAHWSMVSDAMSAIADGVVEPLADGSAL